MARFVHALNSNYVSDVGLGQLTGRVFSEGVLGETDFEVTEKQTGRNMSVDISPGALIIHNPSGHGHLLYSTEVENVPLAPSDPLNPRKSLIVAVLDVNYTNAAVNDAEGGWEFIEVAGAAAATPAEPDAAAIQAEAGAGNLYQVIQLVDVPANTPDIEDDDLTDRREPAQINRELIGELEESNYGIGTIPASALKSEAWTPYTPSWTTTNGNGSIGNGTIYARYKRTGTDVTVQVGIVIGSTTNFGSGALLIGLPIPASSSYPISGGFQWTTVGTVYATDVGSGDYFGLVGLRTTTQVVPRMTKAANARQIEGISASAPFAWAAGDFLSLEFTYEAED